MASLTGTKIKDTYDALLKVSDNGALDGTLQTITDGLGNNSALSLSTAGASVGGTLAVSGAATLSSTLGVTGLSTLSSLAVTGNLTVDTNTLFVDATKESIGVGIAPFENSLTTSMDFEGGGGIFAYGNGVYFNGNLYYDGGWKLKATGVASNYLADGNHIFYTTASGTAGDSVSTVERVKIYNGGDISFRDSSANEAFYWDASAASLGIGTNSINLTAAGRGVIDLNGSSSSLLAFSAGGVAKSYLFQTGSNFIITNLAAAGGYLAFENNGSERMRIDSSGNVTAYKIIQSALGSGGISLSGNSSPDLGYIGYNYYNVDGTESVAQSIRNSWRVKFGNGADKSLSFDYREPNAAVGAFTERMRITSEGYLKACDTGAYVYPSTSFHEITNTSNNNTALFIAHRGASTPYGIDIRFTAASPNNTTNYFLYASDSTAARCIIYSNGNVVNANNSYGAISDAKLKENVTDASPKLEDLMQVKVRNFNYIGDDKKQLGVVAQELEEVFPSMIDESPDTEERDVEVRDEEGNIVYKTEQVLVSEAVLDEEGNVIEEAVYETIVTDEPEMTKERVDLGTVTKSVKYSVFVPMLIKAMQEQQEIINDLKARIEQLEA